MSKDRRDEQPPSPRTTIVGGRPPEGPGKNLPVPTGLQRLLRLGAADRGVAELVLDKRDAVADAAEVPLTPTERAILRSIPEAQLATMMHRLPTGPPSKATRAMAAAAVLLLGGVSLPACDGGAEQVDRPTEQWEVAPTGIAPDIPPPRPDENEMLTDGGAAPDEPLPPEPEPDEPTAIPELDEPEVEPEAEPQPEEFPVTRGIMSDIPPERFDENEMMRAGGAAPDLPEEDEE